MAEQTFFFQMAGINDPFRVTIYQVLAQLIGTIVGMWLQYKVLGRRSIMLIGTALAGLCMFGVALADTIKPASVEAAKVFAGLAVVYGFFNGCFFLTLSWPLMSEIPSSRLRVLTTSFGLVLEAICACKCYLRAHIWLVQGATDTVTPDSGHLHMHALLHQLDGTELGCKVLLDLGGIQCHNIR